MMASNHDVQRAFVDQSSTDRLKPKTRKSLEGFTAQFYVCKIQTYLNEFRFKYFEKGFRPKKM